VVGIVVETVVVVMGVGVEVGQKLAGVGTEREN
jgi:hypothetical protein